MIRRYGLLAVLVALPAFVLFTSVASAGSSENETVTAVNMVYFWKSTDSYDSTFYVTIGGSLKAIYIMKDAEFGKSPIATEKRTKIHAVMTQQFDTWYWYSLWLDNGTYYAHSGTSVTGDYT
jgi:hypothetical protein